MAFPLPQRPRIWCGTAMFAAFMLYCEAYSLIGDETVSPLVSGRWAISATLCWGCLLMLLHANRLRLRSMAAGSWRDRALLLVALAFAALVADRASLSLSALVAGNGSEHPLAERLYLFGPRALMLGAIMVLALLLWERHMKASVGESRSIPAQWLAFPEAPMLRIRAQDVSLIRSAGNYCELLTGERSHLVRTTLGEMGRRLAPIGFLRVHRQAIVNAGRVREIFREPSGRIMVRMDDNELVAAGRHYVDDLRKRFGYIPEGLPRGDSPPPQRQRFKAADGQMQSAAGM